eukprot:SAG25_NODE_111_length_14954_cov_8.187950_18_plen_57_part_00
MCAWLDELQRGHHRRGDVLSLCDTLVLMCHRATARQDPALTSMMKLPSFAHQKRKR